MILHICQYLDYFKIYFFESNTFDYNTYTFIVKNDEIDEFYSSLKNNFSLNKLIETTFVLIDANSNILKYNLFLVCNEFLCEHLKNILNYLIKNEFEKSNEIKVLKLDLINYNLDLKCKHNHS